MPRTYVITGTASGIGRVLAERVRAAGDTVIGVDLKNADVEVDLTTDHGRAELVSRVTELSGGRVDAVVAVAGLSAPIPATASVNYFGQIATLEGLRPLLAASDAPRAALVASLAAIEVCDDALLAAFTAGDEPAALARAEQIAADSESGASNTIYNSSKRAIAEWVRREAPGETWAGAGIPLNAIAPGVVETPMIAELLATDEGRALLAAGAPMPLNGPAAPSSAPAELLRWLTSESNSHVTGQVIYIDGGADAIRRPESI